MSIFQHLVFPSIISEIQCDCFSSIKYDLIEWIEEYKKDKTGVIFSNRGGWQSESNINHIDSFQPFLNYILTYAKSAVDIYNLELTIMNIWVNINRKGDYNITHCHPGSILSGVLWVKCPQNCGSLSFESPNQYNEEILMYGMDSRLKEKFNYFSQFTFSNPIEGTMLMFPSHMRHLVEPNESDEERISIAFNLTTS